MDFYASSLAKTEDLSGNSRLEHDVTPLPLARSLAPTQHARPRTRAPAWARLADLLHQTVHRFYHPDASFSHPLCLVRPGPQSREHIEGVYQYFRLLSPHTKARLNALCSFAAPGIRLIVGAYMRVWGAVDDKESRVLFADVMETQLSLHLMLQRVR